MDAKATAASSRSEEDVLSLSQLPRIVSVILILVVYFLVGKASLTFASIHPSASPVWFPTGIALAAFLLLGYRIWPGVFLAAFLVNLTTAGSAVTYFGIAVGNTLEGITGAYLVNRFARGCKAFHFQFCPPGRGRQHCGECDLGRH